MYAKAKNRWNLLTFKYFGADRVKKYANLVDLERCCKMNILSPNISVWWFGLASLNVGSSLTHHWMICCYVHVIQKWRSKMCLRLVLVLFICNYFSKIVWEEVRRSVLWDLNTLLGSRSLSTPTSKSMKIQIVFMSVCFISLKQSCGWDLRIGNVTTERLTYHLDIWSLPFYSGFGKIT